MEKGRKTTLEERIEIVSYCIAHGKDYALTIKEYHVSYYQIYGWLRKFEAEGPKGLLDRRGRRKDMLPVSEIAPLSERRLTTGTGKTRGSAEASAADGTAAGGEELSQEKRGEIIDIRLRIQSELLEKLSEV